MEFSSIPLEQYRTMPLEKLEQRRSLILGMVTDGCPDDVYDAVISEADAIASEVERRNKFAALRSATLAAAATAPATPITTYGSASATAAASPAASDGVYADSIEYRSAFRDFVCRGIVPSEDMRNRAKQSVIDSMGIQRRDDQFTHTTDASVVVPTVLLNRIIEKMDSFGNVWAKVTKINVQGGVDIPVISIKPTASWIDEDTVSDYQKLTANDKVSFKYYQVEARVSRSILASTVMLDMFESRFIGAVSEAIVREVERTVFLGTGVGQPLGITRDERIASDQKITMSEAELTDFEAWHKKFLAAIPLDYADGELYMAKGTWDYISGMVDKNGQPIARVNYGINGTAERRIEGYSVELVSDSLLKPVAKASTSDPVIVFGQLSDYIVNTNLAMEVVEWVDHETNEVKDKALMIVDGKVGDPYGFRIVSMGAGA